ncbi:MAG: nicotinamide mononucleotide transporter [Flavobacteriaceae bacterium]|nr:nicotinamide mononucleotide transporter [Flavobacteriaceae bacterium]
MNPYELFIKPYEEYTFFQIFLEAVAAFFGLLSVFFSVKRNIWVYPTGIISTTIYVYILFNFGLLGDMLINVYYSIMSIYGWISWNKNTENQIISVDFAKKKDWLVGLSLFVLSFIAVCGVYYFKPFIDNHFSMNGVSLGFQQLDWANWLDIFTTSLFLIGMWFMAKRKVENWLFWIVGDLICIPMMLYKGLGITSLQYLVFTIMAVMGYLEWMKQVKK